MKNNTLSVLKRRGLFRQCSDEARLTEEMGKGPVTFYCGLDPTYRSLHCGHLFPLMMAAHLQHQGHRPLILVGGGTARIGDPSGTTSMRKVLSTEEISHNAVLVGRQITKVLRFGPKVTLFDNSAWLADLNYITFLRDIGSHFSVNRMLGFETFKTRMTKGLSFVEFNYQLLQSYDFLVLHEREGCLLQIGGDDQWGNMVAGIELIRKVRSQASFALTAPLLLLSDGRKMGKTETGAIFLDSDLTSPYDFFQYWRNVPDPDVSRFLLALTFLPEEECQALGEPSLVNRGKERLAYEMTRIVHGEKEANQVLDAVKAAFHNPLSSEAALPSVSLERSRLAKGLSITDLFAMTPLCASKSEARRLIMQGGAKLNGKKILDAETSITVEAFGETRKLILRAGKKRLCRLLLTL